MSAQTADLGREYVPIYGCPVSDPNSRRRRFRTFLLSSSQSLKRCRNRGQELVSYADVFGGLRLKSRVGVRQYTNAVYRVASAVFFTHFRMKRTIVRARGCAVLRDQGAIAVLLTSPGPSAILRRAHGADPVSGCASTDLKAVCGPLTFGLASCGALVVHIIA